MGVTNSITNYEKLISELEPIKLSNKLAGKRYFSQLFTQKCNAKCRIRLEFLKLNAFIAEIIIDDSGRSLSIDSLGMRSTFSGSFENGGYHESRYFFLKDNSMCKIIFTIC